MKTKLSLMLCVFLMGTAQAEDFINIRTNPFMIIGDAFVNLELDVRTTDHWTVGPFAQMSALAPVFDVGVRATHFEQGVFANGWMTGFEAFYRQTDGDELSYDVYEESFCNYETNTCGLSAEQRIGVSVDHGYFWRWGTFNVGAGVGAQVQTNLEDIADVALLSRLHFSIGWVR